MTSPITDTMQLLLDCVCDALVAADRPVCGCGIVVGPPVVGPTQCCECDAGSGQATVSLERVYPADGPLFDQVTRRENCRPGAIAADLSFVVSRCYPSIDDTGNYPDLDTLTVFAENLNTDMAAVWNALKCCGTDLIIGESAVDSDPDGGCSAFAVRVTVPVSLPATEIGS